MTDSSARSTYRRPVRRVPPGTWNTERVITALVDWTSEFGRPPRTFEWGPPESAADAIGRVRARRWAAEYPRWPAWGTVIAHCGSWSQALETAGLRKRRAGPWNLDLPERVHTAKRMHSEGVRVSEIAAHLTVHPDTVRAYLNASPCPECGDPVISRHAKRCRACHDGHPRPSWSRERILQALRDWTEQEGEPPRVEDWDPSEDPERRWAREWPRWPSSHQVLQQFGRWRLALQAASLNAYAHNGFWNRESILAAIKTFASQRKRAPGWIDLEDSCFRLPSHSTLLEHFDSIEAARREAGLTDPYAPRWNAARIITAIQEFELAHQRAPTRAEWSKNTAKHPGFRAVERCFGSWRVGILAAGIAPARIEWDNQSILDAIQRYTREHGRPPTTSDWARRDPGGRWPQTATAAERFGSWRAALREADVPVTEPWDRARISDALCRFAEQHNRPPRWSDLNPAHALPAAETIIQHFGSLDQAFKTVDLQAPHRPHWDRASVIEAATAHTRRHGSPPRQTQWRNAGQDHPSAKTVARLFGSWPALLQAAGIASDRPPTWSAEQIIRTLRDWADTHKRPPHKSDWQRRDSTDARPTATTVAKRFGTWNTALQAAGLHTTSHRSRPPAT